MSNPAMRAWRIARQRASMLIVVLGVLTMMSMLAVILALYMEVERGAASNFVENVRARMAADAGLEQALIRLKEVVTQKPYAEPTDAWVYNGFDYKLSLNEMARNIDRAGGPGKLRRDRGPSGYGTVQSHLGGQSENRYVLQVVDTSSQINLNTIQNEASIELQDTGSSARHILVDRMGHPDVLLALGAAIKKGKWKVNPFGNNATREQRQKVVQALLDYRDGLEGGRFATKTQILDGLRVALDQAGESPYAVRSYFLLEPHITAYAWEDDGALAPTQGATAWSSPPSLKARRRSPVNINTASLEVLTALLAPLSGRAFFYWPELNLAPEADAVPGKKPLGAGVKEETVYNETGEWVFFGHRDPESDQAFEWASKLAERIVADRSRGAGSGTVAGTGGGGSYDGPFSSYAHLNAYIDQLGYVDYFSNMPRNMSAILSGALGSAIPAPFFAAFEEQCKKSILKANFCPTGMISYFNPDRGLRIPVDRGNLYGLRAWTDLTQGHIPANTFDACFTPMGIFEITSLGQIVGDPRDIPDLKNLGSTVTTREVYAEAKVRTVVQLMDHITHRTQWDFERYNDQYYPGNGQREGVRTWPENDIYWLKTLEPTTQETLLGQGQGYAQIADDQGKIVMDAKGHPYGWVTMDSAVERREILARRPPQTQPPVPAFESIFGSERRFDALYDLRRVQAGGAGEYLYGLESGWGLRSSFVRDNFTAGNGQNGATREGLQRGDAGSVVSPGGFLFPDGLHNTQRRYGNLVIDRNKAAQTAGDTYNQGLWVWYRAASTSEDPKEQGQSDDGTPNQNLYGLHTFTPPSTEPKGLADGQELPSEPSAHKGNIGIYKGALEFWYKPDYDWSLGGRANPVIAGLFSASTVRPNPAHMKLTRGTQMFIWRSAEGDLRATRLYHEALFDKDGSQFPKIKTPDSTGEMTISEYIANMNKGTKDYTWPPKGLDLETRCRFARTDTLMPYSLLQDWRAGEWHHLAVFWDDGVKDTKDGPRKRLRIYVDGNSTGCVGRSLPDAPPPPPSPLPLGAGIFVQLNQEPSELRDRMTFGCLPRFQALASSGVFKFRQHLNQVANGTVDDLRIYTGSSKQGDLIAGQLDAKFTLDRYGPQATYTSQFDLTRLFTPGVQRVELARVSMIAWLPDGYRAQKASKSGSASVSLELGGLVSAGGGALPAIKLEYGDPSQPKAAALDRALGVMGQEAYITGAPGMPVRLSYTVRLTPLKTTALSVNNVLAPVLDAVTLSYFLPSPRVLLKEKVTYDPYAFGIPGLNDIAAAQRGSYKHIDPIVARGGEEGSGTGGGHYGGGNGGSTVAGGGKDGEGGKDGHGGNGEGQGRADGKGTGSLTGTGSGELDQGGIAGLGVDQIPYPEGLDHGLLLEEYVPGGELDDYVDPQREQPTRQVVIERVDMQASAEGLDQTEAQDHFAYRITGQIYAHRAGRYVFYLTSSDGARLKIDHAWAVKNDGCHDVKESEGAIELAVGWHRLAIDYFEADGEAALILEYKPPRNIRMVVPAEVFVHKKEEK